MCSSEGALLELRAVPATFDPAVVRAIDQRLADATVAEDVVIPLAIESGSRAWGFPSPDSDYDCRFVFIRPAEQYLSLWPRRDVIETPLDSVLDVNGWELRKALKLLLKGNAVIIEWLTSPVIYQADAQFRDSFLALARRLANPNLIARHYLHLGLRQRRTYFGDPDQLALKKLFYAIRPAAALRWLQAHPGNAAPPMHFPTLMDECAPPPGLRAVVDDLMAKKAITHELGTGPIPREILAFIDAEFAKAEAMEAIRNAFVSDEGRAEAEAFFKAATRHFERTITD
jgi:predicted nucleotidyltransferase